MFYQTPISKMKRVLVVGATGYLGKHLIHELKAQGHWVRALVRNREKLWKRGAFLEPAVGSEVDEIIVAEATQPQTIQGISHGIDFIFSTMGLSQPAGGVTYWDVDFQANQNILEDALAYSIEKFVVVARYARHLPPDLPAVLAREKFIQSLQTSPLTSYVVRATSFYSEMTAFLNMAQRGKAYILNRPGQRNNPIHGSDLAKLMVKGMIAKEKEINIGGPKVYSQEELAKLAFETLNKPPKIQKISARSPFSLGTRLLNPQRAWARDFLNQSMLRSGQAPTFGEHALKDYFADYIQSPFFRP